MMVGKKVVLNIERSEPKDPADRLCIEGLSLKNQEGTQILDHVSFTARSGEILGIAGIADRRNCWKPSPDFSILKRAV